MTVLDARPAEAGPEEDPSERFLRERHERDARRIEREEAWAAAQHARQDRAREQRRARRQERREAWAVVWTTVWPRALAVLVVAVVGAPAAIASYRHAREVVARFDPVMAPWLPLSVDGMLVAALVVIWLRRYRGEKVGIAPWAAFAFGMVVTTLANIAVVKDWTEPRAWAVALFPPLAFAISLELVAMVLRPTRPAPGPVDDTCTVADEPPTAEASPADDEAPGTAGLDDQHDDDQDDDQEEPVDEHQDDDSGPLPQIDSHDPADYNPGSPAWTRRYQALPGDTKLAKAEAFLLASWERGEEPVLLQVDRVVNGNRTASTAKRKLAERGILPPSERAELRSVG